MLRILSFKDFINENSSVIQNKRITVGNGRNPENWFNRDEILYIRDWGESRGVEVIESFTHPKCDGENYFGDTDGMGLNQSAKEFFRGGNLCSEVNLNTEDFSGKILKKNGVFKTPNGDFRRIQQALPL